ncbi:MAG: GtrA family protein [Oscillospiraceae bacterium]
MSKSKTSLSAKESFTQVAKFVAFSLGAGIIQLATFTLLNEVFKLKYWPSYLVALTLSVLYNFTVNRRYTFKSATNIPIAMLKVALYYCVFTPISTIGGNFFTEKGVNEYIVLAITMLLNMSTEFLFCRYVVYKKSINTNNIANKKD